MLLVLSFLGADERGVLGPRGKGDPGVVQDLDTGRRRSGKTQTMSTDETETKHFAPTAYFKLETKNDV